MPLFCMLERTSSPGCCTVGCREAQLGVPDTSFRWRGRRRHSWMFLTPCSDGGAGGGRTGCSCHVIQLEGQEEAGLDAPAMLFRWRSRRRQSCSCCGYPDLVLSPDICSKPGFPRFSLIQAVSKARRALPPTCPWHCCLSQGPCHSVCPQPSEQPLLTTAVVAACHFFSSFLSVRCVVTSTALLRSGHGLN